MLLLISSDLFIQNISIKVAPKVENAEVFKKGWNFANRSYFASCIMKKYYFLYVRKNQRFVIIFTMKLFSTALSYLISQLTLNFTWTHF